MAGGGNGAFALGFALVAGGLWFADSAFHGRPPLATLEAIIRDPNNMQTILAGANGTTPKPNIGGNAGGRIVKGVLTGPAPTANAGAIIAYAEAQVGKPYIWGGTGPKGYDCSGLIWAAYRSVGIHIPRVTGGMLLGGKHVPRGSLQPGDLVFPEPGHVMLYVGGGSCVEAPHTGAKIHMTGIYRFFTARRYLSPGSTTAHPHTGGTQ